MKSMLVNEKRSVPRVLPKETNRQKIKKKKKGLRNLGVGMKRSDRHAIEFYWERAEKI